VRIYLLLIVSIIFVFSSFTLPRNIKNYSSQDSLTFSKVEYEFNLLMDTTNSSNYKKFQQTYSDIIKFTSYPGTKYDFTEFNKIYEDAKEEIQSKINGFSKIVIPTTLDSKVIKRLEESKSAFITAYSNLLFAIERLYLHSKERFGVYLIDYNNSMLEFNTNFNKGILKFAQAKIKIK